MEKNGHVYSEIRKGIYILQQVGLIANDFLTKLSHDMDTASVGTQMAYGRKNRDHQLFHW